MSQEERELMRLLDEQILSASPKELAKLQEADIRSQLDGVWFYDTCNHSEQIKQKDDITTNKLFSK